MKPATLKVHDFQVLNTHLVNAVPVKTNKNSLKTFFLPRFRDTRKQAFIARLSGENSINLSIEHCWTESDMENPKFSEKNLSSRHFCNHKSYID
jgi:hypothetical protein